MTVTAIRDEAFLAARQVMKSLRPTEDAIDQSIIENANLLGKIIQARLAAKVGPDLGHDAVVSSVAMLSALTEARGLGIVCHRQLAKDRDTLGFDGNDLGCTVTKGEPSAERQKRAPSLAAVAA